MGHGSIANQSAVRLTPREREVYALIREGLTDRQIAAALVISEATAKRHAHNIYEKTGVRSRRTIMIQAALERSDQATSAIGESSESGASS